MVSRWQSLPVFRIRVIERAKELVDELSNADITADSAEEIWQTVAEKQDRKPKQYDEVDLEQMSLFDTVQDEDILKELEDMDISDADADGCAEYHYTGYRTSLKNRW